MNPTAVYLMRNIWAEANYKIGISSIPYRRKWQVEESYGVAPVIAAVVWFPTRHAAETAEKALHGFLAEYRTDDHGGKEWFCLPQTVVDEFIVWSKQSPDGAMLKLQVKADKLSRSEARKLTTQLLGSIPYGRRTRPT
jgi:hypothetical protein